MKKLLLLVLTLAIAACPVACVNDPTTSQDLGWKTGTDSSSATGTDTGTGTSTGN